MSQSSGEYYYNLCLQMFSPSAKHLVSVGYQHDRQIIVWNWKVEINQNFL